MSKPLPLSDGHVVYVPMSPSPELKLAVASCVFYFHRTGVSPTTADVATLLELSPEAVSQVLEDLHETANL